MTHRNIYSWVEDLRGPRKSPYYDDDDGSAYLDEEEAEREWHAAKARAALEGKYLSFAETDADARDPWNIGDGEESDGEKAAPKDEKDWRPAVPPEPLRPKRSDTTKVNQLHRITEGKWDEEMQVWSAGSVTTVKPNQSIENLQKPSKGKGKAPSHVRTSTDRPNSRTWTLTPSDAPYRPSWLNDRNSQNTLAHTEHEIGPRPIAKMHGNPYESERKDRDDMEDVDLDNPGPSDVRRPSSVYQPQHNRETLQPGDSISCVGLPEPVHNPPGRSKAPPGPRISVAPQLPPTLHTSPRASNDVFANYRQSYLSRDIEMRPIYSVPIEKLPEPYKPEQPLNGRTAWLQALAGFLVVFNCWGITNAFGLFQAYYEEYYLHGTSPSSIAWIGSTQLCLVFGLGVPVGRLVDKGYFAIVFHSGTLLIFIGLLCTSRCSSLGTLVLVQGLVTGAGMGMAFSSGLVALMTWFDEQHLSMAMGLCAAGSCVGGIVYVLIARSLLLSHGFGTTLRVLSAVAATTIVPANFIVRVRGQKRASFRRDHTTQRAPPLRSFLEPSYLLVASGLFFAFLGVYFGFVYIVTYGATVLQLTPHASTNLLIFMLLANLPGRFLPALISDKCIGPLNTIIPSLFISAAILFLWTASAPSLASLTVIACFYGFASAGVQVLYAPTMYGCCVERTVDAEGEVRVGMDRIGIKAGGISTCIGLACLVGTPIGGALIKYRTDRGLGEPFLGAQIFAGVSLLVAGALLLGSRVARVGWEARRV